MYIIETFQQHALRKLLMGLISPHRDKAALQPIDRTHVSAIVTGPFPVPAPTIPQTTIHFLTSDENH